MILLYCIFPQPQARIHRIPIETLSSTLKVQLIPHIPQTLLKPPDVVQSTFAFLDGYEKIHSVTRKSVREKRERLRTRTLPMSVEESNVIIDLADSVRVRVHVIVLQFDLAKSFRRFSKLFRIRRIQFSRIRF